MKPDLDAIRARCEAATRGPWRVDGSTYDEDCNEHLAPYGLEGPNERLIWSSGGGEYAHPDMATAQFIAHARTDIPALLAYVEELEAEVAILRPWSVMLKRAHGALTDAGCVVPLEFDQSIEHAIKDLANRATRAEQLFVDEYDARRDVERQRDELQARITTLEAMKP